MNFVEQSSMPDCVKGLLDIQEDCQVEDAVVDDQNVVCILRRG